MRVCVHVSVRVSVHMRVRDFVHEHECAHVVRVCAREHVSVRARVRAHAGMCACV